MYRFLMTWFAFTASLFAGESQYEFARKAIGDKETKVAPGVAEASVVWFVGTQCPMAKLYAPRMVRLYEEYHDRGVQFIGINGNRQDSIADTQEFVGKFKIPFPVIHDAGNVLTDQYGASRVTEVVLLNDEAQLQYRGRIDDQYEPGVTRSEPRNHDLRNAIEDVLNGRNVKVAETEPFGCLIGRVRHGEAMVENDVTFSNQVIRVLQNHCIECHREGEIAPFAMTEFDEVVGWAEMMVETIDQGRMPPWGADPKIGHFANERLMPDQDKQILKDWIAGGLKQGDPANLPEMPDYVKGWQFERKPDLILPMRERPFQVRAEGTIEYQYFVVDPGLKEDRWVEAAQIVPGNASVVHHAIAFVRPPDGRRLPGIGWLTAYVPGQRHIPMPKGYARLLPAGSKIVFQMHYTPNGLVQEDTTKIGLLFMDEEEVTHEVMTLIGIEQEFEIPPHAANHEVAAEVRRIPADGVLLGMAPHMHYRGKAFDVFIDQKDQTEHVLSVPYYDFNWQHSYALAEPIPLNEVNRLHFVATFDNSKENPFNPDPTERVTWGDQSWEEMAVGFFEVARPWDPKRRDRSVADKTLSKEQERSAEEYVQRVLRELDSNQDGRITQSEAPIVVRQLSFKKFDSNNDGVITRDEIVKVARRLQR